MLMAGLMPAIKYSLPIIMDAKYWEWWITISGFLGFYTIFLRVPFIIKFIAAGTFALCFFSSAPSISFTQYIVVVSCCYFYILCLNIKNYETIWKCLQCLLLFNLFFFVIQLTHNDSLLNFGITGKAINYGIVGYRMQSASFITILSATLIPFHSFNLATPFVVSVICNAAGSFLAVSAGLIYLLSRKFGKRTIIWVSASLMSIFIIWMVTSGKLSSNMNMGFTGGRMLVWIRSLQLSMEHPFTGYGIATYKGIFPVLGGIHSMDWKTAHNSWVQIIFETGYIFPSVLFGYFSYLFWSLLSMVKKNINRDMAVKCVTGLIIIGTDMMFHFPDRQIQTALIIIFFLAYIQKVVYCGARQSKSSEYSTW